MFIKKLFLIVPVIVLAGAGIFYYYNLRGVAPSITKPVADITTQLAQSPKEAENKTNIPLKMPDGFSLSVFARNLGGPRVLTWDPTGTLVVSIPGRGNVVALIDVDQDGVSEKTVPVATGLNKPHGLAFRGSKLFIAEVNAVSVYDYDAVTKKTSNRKKILDLPSGGNHVTRTIGFGPDGKLYISIGSSCNVCIEKDWRRAAILTANEDGSNLRIFASGLRNAVFFTWNPEDSQLWATNMGRDLIGDDIPPETVVRVRDGDNFGWPYCYGQRIWDTKFEASEKAEKFCRSVALPVIEYQAHSAPLGLVFIPSSWPAAYSGNILVAFHGSWNRTNPTGYKIVRFILKDGKYTGSEDFISGWLTENGALGRPVDVLFDQNGVLYITDDKSGVVYRLSVRQ